MINDLETFLPGENNGIVLGDVFVSSEVFVGVPAWVVIVWHQRECPS
jgi:hypothetical protein